MGTMRPTTSVTSSRIPLNMDTSNTSARHTATTWSGSTAIITASGSRAGFPLRSPHLIGLSPPTGVGIVRAIILSCTTIPTIPDGIWCTTPKPASMRTPSTWVSKALHAQSVLHWGKRRASSHDCSRRFPNQTHNSPCVLCALCVIFSVFFLLKGPLGKQKMQDRLFLRSRHDRIAHKRQLLAVRRPRRHVVRPLTAKQFREHFDFLVRQRHQSQHHILVLRMSDDRFVEAQKHHPLSVR